MNNQETLRALNAPHTTIPRNPTVEVQGLGFRGFGFRILPSSPDVSIGPVLAQNLRRQALQGRFLGSPLLQGN